MKPLRRILFFIVAVCVVLSLLLLPAAAFGAAGAETANAPNGEIGTMRAEDEDAGNTGESAESEAIPSRAPQQSKKLVALTFDDGPGADTQRLLNALRVRHAHCTFFIVGRSATARPGVVRQCYEDGHQIGCHTYSHPYLTQISDAEFRQEISRTSAVLDNAIGASNTYFLRPPYGACNQHVLDLVNVPVIIWSVDSRDWSLRNADATYRQVISTVKDGDIIGLHDSHSWSVDAAIRIVDRLQADGYEFVTVSELFRRRGTVLRSGCRYYYQRSSGNDLPAISPPSIEVQIRDGNAYAVLSADEGTKIYYTLDGTVPNTGSLRYTEPIPMTSALNITAVAGYDMNGSRSELSRKTLELPQCERPDLTISEDGLVTISGSGALRYTTDDTAPTEASALYEAPFTVDPGTVVRAIACSPDTGMLPSEEVRACFSHRGNVFTDVFPGHWYYSVLDEAKSIGLMNGVDETSMEPNATATRAMLAQLLYRMAGKPRPEAAAAFSDVPTTAWYAKAVAWAQQEGIIKGYPDGTFQPNSGLSRQDAATLLARFARFSGMQTTSTADLSDHPDSGEISNYALSSMRWAVELQLLRGTPDGCLNPRATATRAELAAILLRFLKLEETDPGLPG